MDTYELSDTEEPAHRKKSPALVWNVLTILVVVTIVCVVSVFFLIFMNPYSGINPFPPPTLNTTVAPPTATVTPRFTLIPSWTPTNVMVETTGTPEAINVPSITETPSEGVAVMEVTLIPPPGGFSFIARQGSPSAIDGASFHPDAGCKWSGVAGQATSLNGESVQGLFVQLGGSMPGADPVNKLAMTGLAAQYGAGGFEISLADKVIASNGTLWIQLLDQQNLPLSDRVYFDTYDDCQKNLVIIYFDQVK
jgi:heme/copper-type cytochrome/quinol oxidase subunit 2